DRVRDVVGQVRENRGRLVQRLQELGVRCWPSAANCVLLQVPAGPGTGTGTGALDTADAAAGALPGDGSASSGAGSGRPRTAAEWNEALRRLGVAVRPFPAVRGAGDCLRVSIGPWPMMERFLEAFETLLRE